MRVVGIFITGPSSTGKTFLCNALNSRLEEMGVLTYHVSEVARTVMREQGFTRRHVGTLAMQRAILKAQIRAEKVALTHIMSKISQKRPQDMGPSVAVLLCDRCAVDPIVYATMEPSGDFVDELMLEYGLEHALTRYRGKTPSGDTLLKTDEWRVDDGVRSLYDPKSVAVVFREVLAKLKIDYLEIGEGLKDIDERVTRVLAASGLKDQHFTHPAKAML